MSGCGPVAVFNLLRFFGHTVGKDTLSLLYLLSKCKKGRGTSTDDLNALIKLYGMVYDFNSKRYIHKVPNLKKFTSHVKKGNPAIVCYLGQRLPGNNFNAHYILVVDIDSDGNFVVVNDESTIDRVRPVEMNSYIKFGKEEEGLPVVWLIKHQMEKQQKEVEIEVNKSYSKETKKTNES